MLENFFDGIVDDVVAEAAEHSSLGFAYLCRLIAKSEVKVPKGGSRAVLT
jgi:hypothetical protein